MWLFFFIGFTVLFTIIGFKSDLKIGDNINNIIKNIGLNPLNSNVSHQNLHQQNEQMMHNNSLSNENFNNSLMEDVMEESRKGVTAFDDGGYIRGADFNPSDTLIRNDNDIMNNNI